jgi:alpha-mannosidase
MAAMATFLRVLASPWFPPPLAKALVQGFVAWQVRQLAGADRAHLSRSAPSQSPLGTDSLENPIYLLDGYHGGIPFWDWLLLPQGGLWRTLLWPAVGEVLVRRAKEAHLPALLEIDGYTYATMEAQQPQALARLKEVVDAGTIEIANGTYAQPFLRTLGGESVIRQFAHGLAATEHALGTAVTSYASQEPCFCAQLPQILAGFGIQRALLRTHWAPFGQESAHDAPLLRWCGPDGSTVLAVPRHTWMDYGLRRDLHPGTLRGNLTGGHACEWTAGRLRRLGTLAAARGSSPLLLSKLEDLSPAESPTAAAPALAATPNIHLTALAGYCGVVLAGRPTDTLPTWHPTPDDLPMTLPWGLQGDALMQARDRAAGALLVAEHTSAAIHLVSAPNCASPALAHQAHLHAAWEKLLLAQHHDLHVCGPWLSRRHGRPMSEVACELCAQAEEQANATTQATLSHLLERVDTARFTGQPVLVLNPQARACQAVIRLQVARESAESTMVFDGDHLLPAQATGEGIAFLCDLPPLGWRVLELRQGEPPSGDPPGIPFEFYNEFYEAKLSESGTLTLTSDGQTLLAKGAFLRMWRDGRWYHSVGPSGGPPADARPICKVLAEGPVFVRWRVQGSIGGFEFSQDLTLYRVLPRLDVTLTLDFGDGSPFGPQPDDGEGYYAQDERKLCVCFPLEQAIPANPGRVVCDAPFLIAEISQSRFIGNHWAAVERDGSGLAVLAPGARGYTYDQETGILQRVLAWSPRAWIYASDDSITPGGSRYTTLTGRHTFRYALLPYRRRSEVIAEAAQICQPPPASVGQPSPGDLPSSSSLLRVEPQTVDLSALFVHNGSTYARLWNPSPEEREAVLHCEGSGDPVAVSLRLEEEERVVGGRVPLRPWGVQTIRLPQMLPTPTDLHT